MITIFHGDNPSESRTKYLEFIDQFPNAEILRLDPKSIDLNQINNFVNGGSLLPGEKVLAIDNFFSIPKTNLDKLIKIIKISSINIAIWQDKALNSSQLKAFNKPQIYLFSADKIIQHCLNAIKPHNLPTFDKLYDQIVVQNLFDLFLWYLKTNFRHQLQGNSKFNQNILKTFYLQLIELEFQYKSGQLSLPKEIALKRVLIPLIK